MSATRLTRHIRAPRAVVYRALLDPEAVQRWMVPDRMTSRVHVFEPRGRQFRISLRYDVPTDAGMTDAVTDPFHGGFARLVPDAEEEGFPVWRRAGLPVETGTATAAVSVTT